MSNKSAIELRIVSLKEVVYHDHVDSVTLPTKAGEITILTHHIPLVSKLGNGTIIARSGDEKREFSVTGGFIENAPGSKLTVLLA